MNPGRLPKEGRKFDPSSWRRFLLPPRTDPFDPHTIVLSLRQSLEILIARTGTCRKVKSPAIKTIRQNLALLEVGRALIRAQSEHLAAIRTHSQEFRDLTSMARERIRQTHAVLARGVPEL
jgi:hypothetical protein